MGFFLAVGAHAHHTSKNIQVRKPFAYLRCAVCGKASKCLQCALCVLRTYAGALRMDDGVRICYRRVYLISIAYCTDTRD